MSNPAPPQQPRPMHWPHRSLSQRSMCFWHSDVQDAIEALYDRACCYSPSERRAFVTAVCEGALRDFPASTCAERKASDHCGEATDMIATR